MRRDAASGTSRGKKSGQMKAGIKRPGGNEEARTVDISLGGESDEATEDAGADRVRGGQSEEETCVARLRCGVGDWPAHDEDQQKCGGRQHEGEVQHRHASEQPRERTGNPEDIDHFFMPDDREGKCLHLVIESHPALLGLAEGKDGLAEHDVIIAGEDIEITDRLGGERGVTGRIQRRCRDLATADEFGFAAQDFGSDRAQPGGQFRFGGRSEDFSGEAGDLVAAERNNVETIQRCETDAGNDKKGQRK